MIEIYGSEQICINAAADWGISDPLWVHRTMLEARRRGHNRSALTRIFHNNPAQFFGQHPGFTIRPVDITDRPATLH
jgi:predicted metal-dependent TIM-barrel fold hydrolase